MKEYVLQIGEPIHGIHLHPNKYQMLKIEKFFRPLPILKSIYKQIQ